MLARRYAGEEPFGLTSAYGESGVSTSRRRAPGRDPAVCNELTTFVLKEHCVHQLDLIYLILSAVRVAFPFPRILGLTLVY